MPTQLQIDTQELIAVIQGRGLTLEWTGTPASVNRDSIDAQQQLFEAWRINPGQAILYASFRDSDRSYSDSLQFVLNWGQAFVRRLAHIENLDHLRHQVHIDPTQDELHFALDQAPYLIGAENLDIHWLTRFWADLEDTFHRDMQTYSSTVTQYFADRQATFQPPGRIFFHLVESRDPESPFAFLATYAREGDGSGRHVPLKNALADYEGRPDKLLSLLSTVSRAAEQSSFAKEILDSGEVFQPLRLDSHDAYRFLKDVAIYEQCGILCRLPKWWGRPRTQFKAAVIIGENPPPLVGANAILDFNVELALGDQPISAEDIKALLAQTEGLAYIKGKWVEVNHQALQKLLSTYESLAQQSQSMTLLDAMRFQLYERRGDANNEETGSLVDVSHGQWLDETLHYLTQSPKERDLLPYAPRVQATLREYQERGVSWLWNMRQLGLGALLADDMGLGKTLQVLAFLTVLQQEGPVRALLVVPASLLGNWLEEINKFAPNLQAMVVHPSIPRATQATGVDTGDIVITTYGMLTRYDWLLTDEWDVVILDEAQVIKNPGTKQARAVKNLTSRFRIALTGTPIENRLGDLWSLFDFLNRGLLGSTQEFTHFTKTLRSHPEGYAPLRHIISPFILRRLKTDKTVIADLPDKIEMVARAGLSRQQTALYLEVVEDVAKKLKQVEGAHRRGLILSSLMKLKQICNHPDQYLGQHLFTPEESGKFTRMREIVETIRDRHERVLVFTQFREMADPLADFLKSIFGHSGLILHGETPVKQRHLLVDTFQGLPYVPFMVLSLKAGGVGLNLTQANHVIHFDRWWNPAVENQATDRAFRIGQTKNVLVHKFITQGTIEDKIDAMIREKTQLSQDIVPTGEETWIGDLDNQALMNLFRLDVGGSYATPVSP